MKGKRWIATALVAAVVVIAATGGAVLAGGPGGGVAGEGILSRVAAILGLEEDSVKDAFRQAVAEVRDERFQSRLDALVEGGRLTQEQADEYLEWYQARPDVGPGIGPRAGFGRLGMHGRGFGHGRFRFGPKQSAPSPAPTGLDDQV